MRSIITAGALTSLLVLSACAGDSPPPPPATASRRPPPVAPATAKPAQQVIGADARSLIAQFGTPALDQREGPARKLQFRGPTCVLDAYLYSPTGGGPVRVTWIDTRNAQGNDMDHAACIAALAQH